MVTEPRATSTTTIGHLLRDLAPQVLAAVARRHDDFATAEDAVQEALIAAANQWPAEGVPRNPRGWLYHVAVRRLTDHVRSELARRRREDEVAAEMASIETVVPVLFGEPSEDEDDSLTLLFMCCHPALTPPTAIALTLRAVGGLTTAEIANAFFVPEATMAQRISRAKATIKTSRIPFRMPTDAERSDRLAAVLQVLYLIFNEGYASSVGPELSRPDMSNEAIRLTRATLRLLPGDPEVAGLLALMLLTDARRLARTGSGGELIPLDEQDRALWNKGMIAEGVSVLSSAFAKGAVGAYQLQAAIAAVHDQAARVEDTDWSQVLTLYGLLEQMSDSPMASLSRAVAAAMVHGPQHGLDMIDALERDARIAGHYRLDAVRGHLYEKAGNRELAVKHLRAASERTASIPERDYLRTKIARLTR